MTPQRSRWHSVAIYFGTSFVLHLLWENLQAPLYVGYASLGQHFWICFRATFGDLLVMLLIYLAVATIHRNIFWLESSTAYSRTATWVLSVLIGIVFAVSYELWAVYVAHRWAYDAMPLVPFFKIGLTPVLQMIAIPVITLHQ
jgi:hypothetical protein